MNLGFQKFLQIGIIVIVVFCVLAHGAVEAWSVGILQLVVFSLVAIWAIGWIFAKKITIEIPVLIIPGVLLLILGILQIFPVLGKPINIVSYDIESTKYVVFLLFTILTVQFLAFNLWREQNDQLLLVKFLIIFGTIIAFLSILQMISGSGIFFQYRGMEKGAGQWLTGPFVNHNHLAGFLELVVFFPFSFFLTKTEERFKLLYIFSFVIISSGLILTVSRAGIISFITTTLFLLIFWQINKAKKTEIISPLSEKFKFVLIPIFVILFSLFFFTIWIGIDPLINRFVGNAAEAETFESSRGWIWRNSWNMFTENSISGVGLGAYPTAFTSYAESDGIKEFNNKYLVAETHNDYLQLLTDAGIVGFSFGVLFLLLLFYAINKLLRRIDPQNIVIVMGCVGGVFSILAHSFFDFNLQIPSNSLIFVIEIALISRLFAGIGRITGLPESA